MFAVDRYIPIHLLTVTEAIIDRKVKTEEETVRDITHIVFSIIFISCVLYYVSYEE